MRSVVGWAMVGGFVLVGTATAILFMRLMFHEVGDDDDRWMRKAWWMIAGWLVLLAGAALYFLLYVS